MHFEQSERLDEASAHDEAKMLKVKLAEIVNREPIAEDYEKALQAVEDIKRYASEEPTFDKIVFRVFQIGNKYFNNSADGLLWLLTLGARPDEGDKASADWQLHRFDDASARLQQLKEQAENLGRDH
jgi:hypothetical protein